jgi:hypothetical protein
MFKYNLTNVKLTAYTLFEKFLLSPAYFLLFSAYPVMTLFANNVFQVDDLVFVRPLIALIMLSALLALVFFIFLGSWQKSAIIVSVFLIFFTSYGHVENMLAPLGWRLSPKASAIAWLALLIAVIIILFSVLRKKDLDFKSLAPALNVMAIVLLLFPLAKIIKYKVTVSQPFIFSTDHYQKITPVNPPPDIYYIILDGYARSDIYMNYGFDNGEFINALEEMGFYVAKCSQSNYPNTGLSLTSALNMDYIPNLAGQFTSDEVELIYIFKALQANSVRRMLENAGYNTISYASGFPWAEMRNAVVFYELETDMLNEFEAMFLSTTILRVLDDFEVINISEISGARFRERTRLALNSFDELPNIPGPKFVFMHILASHAPFVFDAEGNAIEPNTAGKDGYANASKYISTQMERHLEKLITQSPTPPIIILQGDHAPWSENPSWRLGILNAYYFPGHDEQLYSTITPVNTFRLVFNSYFGTTYPLLGDRSYDADLPYIYKFTEIPNTCVNP